MSLDRFACHAVHAAVLQGDVDADVGLVLSFLPKTMQESAVSQLKLLTSAATPTQVVNAVESKSVNLAKADFDKSRCRNCLHNSSVANSFVNADHEFKPHLCLFALCAQHDALDDTLLNQRTVVEDGIDVGIGEQEAPASVEDEAFLNDQMDIGIPDLVDEGTCTPPAAQELPFGHEGEHDVTGNPSPTSKTDCTQSETACEAEPTADAPVVQAESYIDVVRNSWWRSALKTQLLDTNDSKGAQRFLIACLATQSVKNVLSDTPAKLFSELLSADGDNTLVSIVELVIDELPLDIVQSFLQEMKVDLTQSGRISLKVLSALDLNELTVVADDFNVPTTVELCDAYDGGAEAFAQAIAQAIGQENLARYVPPSLRY